MKRIIGSQFWGFIKMEFLSNGLESACINYKVLRGFQGISAMAIHFTIA